MHTTCYYSEIFMNIQQDTLRSQWNGKSALMLAAQGGHTETVKALLNAGAGVSLIVYYSYDELAH